MFQKTDQIPAPPVAPALRGRVARAAALRIADVLRSVSGISIDPTDQDFIDLRVGRRLRELGLDDLDDYLLLLDGPQGRSEVDRLVESLATHTTSFFREPAHFDWMLETGLPARFAEGAGSDWPLVVWSAACSLGSELWTAGMVVDRFAARQLGRLRWGLLGTDISRKVLRRAEAAVFREAELGGLTEEMRARHLLRSRQGVSIGADERLYRIGPDLRRRAQFHWANLVDLHAGFRPNVDIAFLRNVLIYFEPDDRRAAVAGVASRLRPGGFLVVGHSENLQELPQGLVQTGVSIYRKDF